MFSGRLHPSELAGKLAREADFARFEHVTGPSTANLFVVSLHPRDLNVPASELESILVAEMQQYTLEQGLRLEGPVQVRVVTSEQALPGRSECHVEVAPGPLDSWSRLAGGAETYLIRHNRVLIGRGEEADVVIAHDDISRRHAILLRQGDERFIRDLGSANGTTVDGAPVGSDPTQIQRGSEIGFSEHRYRFVEPDA